MSSEVAGPGVGAIRDQRGRYDLSHVGEATVEFH